VIRRVIVTPEADRDLDGQFEYLARDSLDVGIRFLRAAHATFDDLLETPGMGTRKQFRNRRLVHVRQWRVQGFDRHLIYYRETPEGIEILRVVHGARDLPRLLEEERE
jgi:toxin ParE1/3/4